MKLSREERRNCIGIAMSGGGLQGIAHIGAIKALYELGIHPQFVSGTSSGAAMAAITAMGFTAEEKPAVGDFIKVKITDYMGVDPFGEKV